MQIPQCLWLQKRLWSYADTRSRDNMVSSSRAITPQTHQDALGQNL